MEPTSNQTPETPETPAATPAPAATPNWTRRFIVGGVALAALGGVGLATAMSDDFGPGKFRNGGWGGHEMRHSGGHGMGGFGERRLDRVLEEIDATPEQATKIKAIVETTGDELFPIAEEFRDTREEVAELLGAATVDRAAAETLRAARVARVDEASRKLTTAALDIAEVLTPEQRAELLEHLKERGGHRRW